MSPQYGGRVEPGSLNPGMALPGHSTGGFTFGALAPTLGSELPAGAVMRAGGFGPPGTMRAKLIGHFQPCTTDIYLHIDARMADYIRTHP